MKQSNENKKWKQYASTAVGVALAAAAVVLCITYRTQIWALITQQTARDAFVEYVRGSGLQGALVFLGVQMLQVIVAVLPGEPVEIMAGALYGTWGGLAMCELGLLLGSIAVYGTVRLLGAQRVDPALLHKYKFLRDEAHVHFFIFLLYFVPGTPKDMLLYLGPFLPIKPTQFFLIALFARIPSVITSTYAGANLVQGRWQISMLVFALTGLAALVCLWQHENLLRFLQKRKTGTKP